eukprot:3616576-Pleurochrysis_carterae.AAC.3
MFQAGCLISTGSFTISLTSNVCAAATGPQRFDARMRWCGAATRDAHGSGMDGTEGHDSVRAS